jgi:hypothetical protein
VLGISGCVFRGGMAAGKQVCSKVSLQEQAGAVRGKQAWEKGSSMANVISSNRF